MAEDLNSIVPVENADARRELLSQQFDEAEAAPQPAQANTAERPRDEAGKFASPKAQAEPEQEPAEEPVWKRPPASWKKDYHEAWQTADDRLKEYAWTREEQMKAGLEPLKSKAQFADQMQEAVQPYMQTIQGLGIDPPRAVKALLEADHALRYSTPEQKLQLFSRLAQQYGVNLGQVQGLPQQTPVDPMVYSLQNELNSVRGEINGWKQQQEQAQNSALLGEINQFSQKVEHFEEARPVMIQLLQSGVAQTLDDAYDKAIRLDPNLFEQIAKAQQAEAAAKQAKEQNRAVKTARAAAVSVRSATPGVNTAPKSSDRRALLEEAFAEVEQRL
jgi:hypothetical protein